MRPYHILLAIFSILFLSQDLISQNSFNEIKKELKSLNGSKYIARAIEGAEILASNGQYDNALDLLDRGVKKSRSIGSGTQAVVHFNSADLIAKFFPKEDKYLKKIEENLSKMADKKPPSPMLEKAIRVLESVNYAATGKTRTKLDNQLINLRNTLAVYDRELLASSRNQELQEFKN